MSEKQIKTHENFGSTHLDAPRNVLVYLPPGYGLDETRRYPVLYMHDGQNLTNPQDAFGGSSLGGLVSLHLGFKRPDVFSRLAVLSPATRFGLVLKFLFPTSQNRER